jgi:hypothetical protein
MASRAKKERALARVAALPDAEPEWDRTRARYASMTHRGTPMPLISTRIRVRAGSPQELEEATARELNAGHADDPEN